MSVAAGLPTGITKLVIDCSAASEMDCRDNELGYMFYHNMGGNLFDNKTGNQTVDGVLLTDVQSEYWSGTEDGINAWFFVYDDGSLGVSDPNLRFRYGWAVRDGDVGPVPIPAAVWLFGSGLLGLIAVARRKKTA
jgi:hypothetical protein